MTLEKLVNRAAEATGVYGKLRVMPSQVDDLALATLSAAAADDQLDLFAKWCYKRHDGLFVNIMPSGQIPSGCWTPWSDSGKSRMSKPDRQNLRAWVVALSVRRHFPPWVYRPDKRRWYVDLTRHPTEDSALAWLAKHRINPKDWLTLSLSRRG